MQDITRDITVILCCYVCCIGLLCGLLECVLDATVYSTLSFSSVDVHIVVVIGMVISFLMWTALYSPTVIITAYSATTFTLKVSTSLSADT